MVIRQFWLESNEGTSLKFVVNLYYLLGVVHRVLQQLDGVPQDRQVSLVHWRRLDSDSPNSWLTWFCIQDRGPQGASILDS